MILTVDLTSEEVARLSTEAAERGLSIAEYARRLLIEHLGSRTSYGDEAAEKVPFYLRTTPEEWKRAIQEWSESHSNTTPLISDEMLRRENMYEDRKASSAYSRMFRASTLPGAG